MSKNSTTVHRTEHVKTVWAHAQNKISPVLTSWESGLEEPLCLRLLKCNPDVRMTGLAIRPRTRDDVLEPLVAIVLPSDGTALAYAICRVVPVVVHLPAAFEPAALAYEPSSFARADEQVGERAPARWLDVHHMLNALTRLARQEAEYRLTGRRRCGLSPARSGRPVCPLCRCRTVLGTSSCYPCRRRRSRNGLGDIRRRHCRRAHRSGRGQGRARHHSVIRILCRCWRIPQSRRVAR